MITNINRTVLTNKKNEWIVIHYVGATSTAENNAIYFNTAYRGASANYFVDPKSIWQVVEDKDGAWHVGGAKTYYTGARNNNSIGIEMCCKWNGKNWYIEPETIENTIWLTKQLMKKYNIPLDHVVRHYDTTLKICPEPFVRDESLWNEFKNRLEKEDMDEPTIHEKCEVIKNYYKFDDNTINYFRYYRYNIALIDKLYHKAKNG